MLTRTLGQPQGVALMAALLGMAMVATGLQWLPLGPAVTAAALGLAPETPGGGDRPPMGEATARVAGRVVSWAIMDEPTPATDAAANPASAPVMTNSGGGGPRVRLTYAYSVNGREYHAAMTAPKGEFSPAEQARWQPPAAVVVRHVPDEPTLSVVEGFPPPPPWHQRPGVIVGVILIVLALAHGGTRQ